MRNYRTYQYAYRFPIILELDSTFSQPEIDALKTELVYKVSGEAHAPILLDHPSAHALPALQEMGKSFNPEYRKLPCKISSYDVGMLLNKCMSIIEGNHVELRYQFPEMGKLVSRANISTEESLKAFVDMAVDMQSLPTLSFIYDTASWNNPVVLSVGKRPIHRHITEYLVPVSKESVINETKKGFKTIPEGIDNLKKIIEKGILHWNKLGSVNKDRTMLGL